MGEERDTVQTEEQADQVEMQPAGAELTFSLEDDQGNEMQCKLLYTFHASHNDKYYLVYTIENQGEESEEVSAFRYIPEELEALIKGEDVDVHLEPLATEVEWSIVADTLRRVAAEGSTVDASSVTSNDSLLAEEEN